CLERGGELIKPAEMKRGGASDIIVVGLEPGTKAAQAGMAFAGNSFTRLHTWFTEAGFKGTQDQLRDALYLTSVLKCSCSSMTSDLRLRMFRNCARFLDRQLALIRPRLGLILGAEAAKLMLGDKRRMKDMI